MRILPGKNRETGIFGLCGRPKAVRMTFSDGTTTVLELADEPALQRFPIEARATWAELEILDSYPGAQQKDTYVSEVEFGSQPAPTYVSFQRLLSEGDAASASGADAATPTTVPFSSEDRGAVADTIAPPGVPETGILESGGRVWLIAAAGVVALAAAATALRWRLLRRR